ncbi:beta-lactamase family protein [Pedobacter sp. PAMC26386]|nr:beta-lactamase family protein [Pedobacter sp. PAMC26386]
MKCRTFILLINMLLLSLCGCKKQKEEISIHQFSSSRIKELNEYLRAIKQAYSIPGLSVGIVHKDSVYNSTLGIADNEHHLIDSLLPFSAGSISEPVMATAILKLVDSGLIKLDDPVQKYLPYFKMADKINKKVTIRHLLSHTSGIQHYPVLWDTPNNSDAALELTTRSISSQQPKFPIPGSRVVRSPYNYDILADLVSKVSGKPFEQYMDQQVFKKLGMKSSSFARPVLSVQPFSINNWLSYTSKTDSLYPYNRENGGSNGLHTSASDLSKWMEMLLNRGLTAQGRYVSKVTFDDFFSFKYMTSKTAGITLGWELMTDGNHELFVKKSDITNFQNQVMLIPEEGIGITFLSNISAQQISSEIVRNMMNWLNGGKLPKIKTPVGLALGQKFQETGNIDSVINLYQSLKRTRNFHYDLSLNALNFFGNTLFRHVGDQESALKIYNLCITEYPRSAEAYLSLANFYIKSRSYSNARLSLEKSRPFLNKFQQERVLDMEQYIKEKTIDTDPG